ncbi:endo alpha-1,4 polygalactosaminidase [Mucilaginibacter sp. JRF]|uniref:endo alpha-1,4 polygalactosaminidase n=1 Tax=Mucilaginibacter sp. JRF TaxID=2780088 RepID=UPI00187F1900|nr:endo alpha-1,4 polygalactosaminidase [Mucilaginibacter sp. JRF]MBE9586403.1 endo alpha-1,4 polygalactosaminidase [Mucilaginibacter sp. JRF]
MFNHKTWSLFLILIFATACKKGSAENDTTNTVDPTELPGDKTTWWQPTAGVSFDWELDDISSSNTFSGNVVDVDAFTTSAETVAALHAQGKKVIAYLSVGTFEDDRPDGSLLPKEVVGKKYDDWPHEKWLDIRQIEKLKPWLNSRFNMILKKGFDAIEPDNLDSYSNTTGFNISIEDTKRYIDFLITLAHSNGLGIGQKNVPDITAQYASKFDWALTEDAFKQGWQNDLKLYIDLKKPVFSTEYNDETSEKTFDSQYCPAAAGLGYTIILKKRDLDAWVHKCQ